MRLLYTVSLAFIVPISSRTVVALTDEAPNHIETWEARNLSTFTATSTTRSPVILQAQSEHLSSSHATPLVLETASRVGTSLTDGTYDSTTTKEEYIGTSTFTPADRSPTVNSLDTLDPPMITGPYTSTSTRQRSVETSSERTGRQNDADQGARRAGGRVFAGTAPIMGTNNPPSHSLGLPALASSITSTMPRILNTTWFVSSSSSTQSLSLSTALAHSPQSAVPELTSQDPPLTLTFSLQDLPPSETRAALPQVNTSSKILRVTTQPSIGCIQPGDADQQTTIFVVYTATTTFFGDPADYRPPFPMLETPSFCGRLPGPAAGMPKKTSSNSVYCSTRRSREGSCATPKIGGSESESSPLPDSPFVSLSKTVTFITTDKNPSVIFRPIQTPEYGKGSFTHDQPHRTVRPAQSARPAVSSTSRSPQPVRQKPPPTPTFTITVAPTKIIIDDQTMTVKPTATTTVTIGGEEFVINPTQVIGGGTTLERPFNGDFANSEHSQQTITRVGQIPIIIRPSGGHSVVLIDGATFSVPEKETTAVVRGITITLQPDAIRFPGQIIPVRTDAPLPTEIIVQGGMFVTAIGQSVAILDGTTITYGPDRPAMTTTISDEQILVGPSDIAIGTISLGGFNVPRSLTALHLVGGITFTQIGASLLVLGTTTFTVGPGGSRRFTTEIGGEIITVGPEGLSLSTLSFPYPFGPTAVTTIHGKPATTAPSLPLETEDENGGQQLARSTTLTILVKSLCIALGVWQLI